MTVSKSNKGEAFFVDRWSPPPDPRVDEGASPGATREAVHLSRRFLESIKPDGRRPFAERWILLVVSSRP